MNFTKTLIAWYLRHKRDLPWRHTTDPYYIWLSEIMLQQTRVAQGMPYYFSFTEAFPTVFDLANASEENVLKLWQGLGYYSRARNLHKTAQTVAFDLGGNFPQNYKDLLKLKGVGDYTAAAIASFSFNENVPVVDGNVFRVLSRYFDIETDIANASAKKEFAALAFELMPKNTQGRAQQSEANPAIFNQAIMEFGALQCVPKNPNCSICPFNLGCLALKLKKVNLLPVKSKKVKVRRRFFNYVIFSDEDRNTVIQKRSAKDIWHNLYEFPLIETDNETDMDFIAANLQDLGVPNTIISISAFPKSIMHKLTHQHLNIKFWQANVSGTIKNGIDYATLVAFPFPIAIFNFIEKELK